jgi:hypothetical protein
MRARRATPGASDLFAPCHPRPGTSSAHGVTADATCHAPGLRPIPPVWGGGEAVRGGRPGDFLRSTYSVDFVKRLASKLEELTVLHLSRDDPEDRLPSGVRRLGIELYPNGRRPRYMDVLVALRRTRPDHVIVCTPAAFIITWALRAKARVLALFADSFGERSAKGKVKAGLLRKKAGTLGAVGGHAQCAGERTSR